MYVSTSFGIIRFERSFIGDPDNDYEDFYYDHGL